MMYKVCTIMYNYTVYTGMCWTLEILERIILSCTLYIMSVVYQLKYKI